MNLFYALIISFLTTQSYASPQAECRLIPGRTPIVLPIIQKKDLDFSVNQFSASLNDFIMRDNSARMAARIGNVNNSNHFLQTVNLLKKSMEDVEGSFSKTYSVIDPQVVRDLDESMQNATNALSSLESALKQKNYWTNPIVAKLILGAIAELESNQNFVLNLSAANRISELDQIEVSAEAVAARSWYLTRNWCEGRSKNLARMKLELNTSQQY